MEKKECLYELQNIWRTKDNERILTTLKAFNNNLVISLKVTKVSWLHRMHNSDKQD
jgi:hypothetical protein